MGREKTILSQNGKKKNSKKKVWLSIEPSTVKSYSSASGRFSHSGSHIASGIGMVKMEVVSDEGRGREVGDGGRGGEILLP